MAVPGRIAFVGCYEPRRCGIGTFTHDLCEAVATAAPQAECYAVAVNDQDDGYPYPPRVRFEIHEQNLDSYRRGAEFLNKQRVEVLCVQHEFGIYGGPAGRHLLTLLREVRMPVVTTLHTVLSDPDQAQRAVMEELVDRSARMVVMARKGAEILRETYGVPGTRIDIIPHGIPETPFADPDRYKAASGTARRRVLLTFGLLGAGKGIEYAIEAMPEIVRRHPDVVYVVLGATHPRLIAREGERYRQSLEQLAAARGVSDHVIFCNRFVSAEELTEFIAAADIYVTPYLHEGQITSGTLAYVFGGGNAVVSTPYWHAQELLADGRGILVPFRDPDAIADGVCTFLDDSVRLARTRREAYQCGRSMVWPAIAQRYLKSFQHARSAHASILCMATSRPARSRAAALRAAWGKWREDLPEHRLDHIMRMSDGTGIFQHATFNVPNFHEGYCTDDNARAFILCHLLETPALLDDLATNYLAFLAAALNHETGRFRNFMSHGRQWLEDEGSPDSHGRALWALGVGVGRSRNEGHRRLSAQLFERGLPAATSFLDPRAWAFSLLGIHEFLRRFPEHVGAVSACQVLMRKLVKLWHSSATDDWPWFESRATYDNARLCQALILCGQGMRVHGDALAIGLKSLRWLITEQTTHEGYFRPIGSNGFHSKHGARADYDQQPLESCAMVAACLAAFRATQDRKWADDAARAFEWFLGRNDLGLPLYDAATGGCGDGLHHDRISANQGAESSLAFHLSLAEMRHAKAHASLPTPAMV